MFRKYLLGGIIWILYRSLKLTWRIQLTEPESLKVALKNKIPFLLAHWHGDEIPLMQFAGRYRLVTIVSTSKDGDLMDFMFRRFGGETTRGSSTRGAVNALKGLLRMMSQGYNSSFAVDGPKGPIYQVKPGIFEVSRLLQSKNGGQIFVSGVHVDRAWVFEKSWNKSYLPKPFAKIHILWEGPFGPIGKDQDPRNPELATTLAEALHKARTVAAKKIAVH